MSQPEPQPQPSPAEARWAEPVEIVCDECFETIAVRNPTELIRSLHLLNECTIRSLLTSQT